MSNTLVLRNKQRVRPLDLRPWRRKLPPLLRALPKLTSYDLGVYFVGEAEMTRINETYLHHKGSTDVITFDYNDPASPGALCGELFICVDEAILQAKRFKVTWSDEVLRYVVHGILHLWGYDDVTPALRRKMKQEEDRLVVSLAAQILS